MAYIQSDIVEKSIYLCMTPGCGEEIGLIKKVKCKTCEIKVEKEKIINEFNGIQKTKHGLRELVEVGLGK